MMNLPYRLTLASKSPRRSALLASLDLEFEVKVKSIDEHFPDNLNPDEVAEYIAKAKSDAFRDLSSDELILTSDTVVICEGKVLAKPQDHSEAVEMLNQLSGKNHQVVTGVCLKTLSKTVSFSETTEVYFKVLTESEILYYIDKYEPFDKAGAYGIQEWIGMIGIEKILGDYYNVMGLPLSRLFETLKSEFCT